MSTTKKPIKKPAAPSRKVGQATAASILGGPLPGPKSGSAPKRIDKNTYGVCELTQKPIPKARLDAIPWTRFTVEAQAQLEREGALRQRKLGQLGTVDSVGATEEVEEEEPEEKPAKEK